MSQENESPANQMLTAISLFIERQMVVLEIMQQMRPDLLALAGATDAESVLAGFALSEKHGSVPQKGIWTHENQEWEYFFHGLGCRLVHMDSGEPIEWDAPNVSSFDREWFLNWYGWQQARDSSLQVTNAQSPSDTFDSLVDSGLVVLNEVSGQLKYQLRTIYPSE
jgi:hypothetical protein